MQVGNIHLPVAAGMWELSNMAEGNDLRGVALYNQLMQFRPDGLAETEWAEAAGVNRSFFSNLKAKSTSPRADTLRKVLRYVGRTEGDLSAGSDPESDRETDPQALEARQAGKARSIEPDQPRIRSVGSGEVVLIPRLDLSLPMGPGATVDDYVEEEPVAFDLGYLRAFTRTPPHRLRLAAGAGDSMFPTLIPNDLVWIDTTQNQLLHADRIYAASINGGAAIKRLRPIAGGSKVLVISDNKTVEPYEVDAQDVVIWGRVIRFARDL